MKKMKQKEAEQIHVLEEIKVKDSDKHQALGQFMKLFASIKQAIKGIRSDYYSHKVFMTLQKLSAEELKKITKALYEIYG